MRVYTELFTGSSKKQPYDYFKKVILQKAITQHQNLQKNLSLIAKNADTGVKTSNNIFLLKLK